jgi:unsaturated chondroitin disaccharide hydrolase
MSSSLEAQESPAELLKKASAIYLDVARTLSPDQGYPRRIEEGNEWKTTPPSGWTSGFFPGILWMLYEYTEDEALLVQAKRWTEGLEFQKTASTHDVGFMIFNSFGRGYRATGSEKCKTVTLEAAEHLASRFNPRVGAIRSWDWDRFTYPVIVDNMMNLELLFWAARTKGDRSLAEIARTHAMTTIRDHVREDGSTYHVVDYRPETGEILSRVTVQGFSDDSMWARGQAWGLYGFTVVYRETKEPVFLETARRLADRFLGRLPEDGIPYWDFDAPQESSEPKDASAAAIAASGLWELASLADDADSRDRYRAASKSLIRNLSSPRYSAPGAGLPAMLLHSTGSKPGDSEVDIPIIYADYYFIEALLRQVESSR